jgi:hypothetical protein
MMDDNELTSMMRSACPPSLDLSPSRDLWPRVIERVHSGPEADRIDMALAALVAVLLVIFPEWVSVLAYHL